MPSNLIVFNKPFHVLSQFTSDGEKATLADYIQAAHFYPAGRLDYDSEGLLLLTNQGALQHLIASPKFKMPKTYWVQVEGEITEQALQALRQGIKLKDGLTLPAQANQMAEPELWSRTPPVRERKTIPTSWLSLTIREGKNRQVRRMTAAVGFPTLRLIRYAIGPYTLDQVPHGQWQYAETTEALQQEVIQFEQRRNKPTSSPHRRRTGQTGRSLPHGNRTSGRENRPQSASRSRGKQ
ncbi:pseudouridine synthase [Marinomonas sp. THO17]|uniref:pseudouridine synthase n=1 Tax=Marinomonas sp. THO17 TaxID=3149048 RepID=UPI00336BCFB0